MPTRSELAAQIVRASRALHARGWVANHDGNVSVRLGDRLLVTPTATSKGDVTEGGLAVTDLEGAVVEGEAKPPSEFLLHVFGCYRPRDDVRAVIHAHPPHATALACAGHGIRTFLAEAVVSIGAEVPLLPLAPPSGREGAAPIAARIADHDAFLMASHGVITVGKDLEQAMLRMELVEHMARIQLLALPVGGVKPLPEAMVTAMLAKRRQAAGTLGSAAAKEGLAEVPAASAGAAPTRSAPASPTAWTPAGPPPAPDAWSGGRTEGACSKVYGSGDAPAPTGSSLSSTVQDAIRQHLRGES